MLADILLLYQSNLTWNNLICFFFSFLLGFLDPPSSTTTYWWLLGSFVVISPPNVQVSTHQLTALYRHIKEFKIYDATVAKTWLKIASSSFSIYSVIMSVCLTFES